MMTANPVERPRILVAGVGNIFLGDDAFGVEVAQRLAQRALPQGVRVVDFGIRGLDLAYALLDGYEAVILVDAAPRGGVPGTLYVLEPELHHAAVPPDTAPVVETHNMDLAKVVRLALALGGPIPRLVLVGCEPQNRDSVEEMSAGLSDAVHAVVDEAVRLVESLVAKLLRVDPPRVAAPPGLAGVTNPPAGSVTVVGPPFPAKEDRTCHP
jgi:hydrogenase maturation protease